jgi:replicative DNA helicase
MSSLDVTTLQILRDRESYDKYHAIVPHGLLDGLTAAILKDYGRYFTEHKAHKTIDQEAFKSAFFGSYHPKLTEEQKIQYRAVLANCLGSAVDPVVRDNYICRVVEQDYTSRMVELLRIYNEGGDINILREITKLAEEAETDLDRKIEHKFIEDDIGELLKSDENHTGLSWRLSCLSEHMRPMIAGDFGIVAGRPDTGKTSFLASELTYLAPQIREAFKADRPAIWFNNEGPGKRIKPRLYQAALDISITQMIDLHKKGKLVQAYKEAIDGVDRIKIMDIHDFWNYEVEEVIKKYNPALIVYDMIDNIKFAGQNAGARTDQVLESMYGWARKACVKYDAIGICTSQISNEGDGLLFPTMGMLKDSKTGKQGACDFQIMIGRSNDFNSEHTRGIGIVKNKLRVDGKPGDPRAEVIFDGNRSRYRDAIN